MHIRPAVAAALGAALSLIAAPAAAQRYEAVGTRAHGMAGAFVAVTDDASATWWNPAGLATGAYFSALFERLEETDPADAPAVGPASERRTSGFAIAYPALGLSYYRFRISDMRPSTAADDLAREDQGVPRVDLRSRAVSEYGATIGQSVGGALVISSTLKLVRAGEVESAGEAPEGSLDRAADADVPRHTRGDIDVGALVSFPHARIGLSVKHLNEPTFGDGDDRFELSRQVRAGVALFGRGAPGFDRITGAVDADLTTTETAIGEVRHVAAGVEAWLLGRRLGVRAGISANTVAQKGRPTSAGVSVGAGSGLYLEGALTVGSDRSRKGAAVGLRMAF